MTAIVVAIFVIGYLSIVFEHPLKIDKTVPALVMGALIWAAVSVGHLEVMNDAHQVDSLQGVLLHHVGKIAEILVFLIGAMTIVELIDLHKGFSVITNRIRTTKKSSMLWIVAILAFFLSAILDNLTTTIVLVSMLRRLVPMREERIWYVCMVIIAANAGGAWSPIGDVTTTMLWIGNHVSSAKLMGHLFIPSLLCLLVPVAILVMLPMFKGHITPSHRDFDAKMDEEKVLGSRTILILGLGGLIFVPIFKTITHLPPYIGMMLSLGIVWLASEIIHRNEDFDRKHLYTAHHALSRIEMSSILFFLGILLAVAALESVAVTGTSGHQVGLLMSLAERLNQALPNQNVVIIILGFLSAVIDNVPLVAAAMGMYNEPLDANLWHFIAYSAGTGGSMLIIGSAAGVAAMGMEKIDFIWYLKNIAWLAMIGFLTGAAFFIFFTQMLGG
jgi:Na+/H+ antiporter NhaD/arsenite permease-like protein